MSASLLKKSLEVVDSDFTSRGIKKPNTTGRYTKSGTAKKIGLTLVKKYTVQEAKRKIKSKKQILEENLKKLELIRKNSQVVLDEDSTKNIIERAVTGRPIKTKEKKAGTSESAFTEEDFRKFEEECRNS